MNLDRARARNANRGAFTLIECVVTVAVVGLLAALTLVAVQAAREASRRVQCMSHLKQIGIAVSHYAVSAGHLPPAMGASEYSAHVSILPNMEQTTLFNSINFRFPASSLALENMTASRVGVAIYVCPSIDAPFPEGSGWAWTSYAGNRGSGAQKYGENGTFRFPPGRTVAYQDIRDGTSRTALFAEWVPTTGPFGDRDRQRAVFHTPRRLDQPDQLDDFAALCRGLDPATARLSNQRKGSNWLYGELCRAFYNHTVEPNGPSCLNGSGYQIGAWTAGSLHPGGTQVLYADGSVHFVQHSIQQEVWRALGSVSGGELFP